MKTVKELLELLELKQINDTTFEGKSFSIGNPNVFGGQVLAQALNAAYRTVSDERSCHSFHAYFILPGDLEKPIVFKVHLVRDGGSFTTRYITANQEDKSIFVMAASFQKEESGYDFQHKMPDAPEPDSLLSWDEIYEQTKDFLPQKINSFLSKKRPLTIKPTVINNPFESEDLPPEQKVWFKFNEMLPDLSARHFHEMLAYASDYNLLSTTILPHASVAKISNTQMASLDHAIWFHRLPTDFSDWFLYVSEVESNANARGLAKGTIYSRDGLLIATVAQEGLIRKIRKQEK